MYLAFILLVVLGVLKVIGVINISWWLVIAPALIVVGFWFLLGYLVILFTDNKIKQEEQSWDWKDR